MSRGPQTFRQRDVTAALKAARAAGCDIERVEVSKDGRIVVVLKNSKDRPAEEAGVPNEWDDLK